jgi:hypothetical protein
MAKRRPLTNAERAKNFRKRKRENLSQLAWFTDAYWVKEILEGAGWLRPDQYDDVAAVGIALNNAMLIVEQVIMKEKPQWPMHPI